MVDWWEGIESVQCSNIAGSNKTGVYWVDEYATPVINLRWELAK